MDLGCACLSHLIGQSWSLILLKTGLFWPRRACSKPLFNTYHGMSRRSVVRGAPRPRSCQPEAPTKLQCERNVAGRDSVVY